MKYEVRVKDHTGTIVVSVPLDSIDDAVKFVLQNYASRMYGSMVEIAEVVKVWYHWKVIPQ